VVPLVSRYFAILGILCGALWYVVFAKLSHKSRLRDGDWDLPTRRSTAFRWIGLLGSLAIWIVALVVVVAYRSLELH
jgi:hypothetical protein